MSRFFLKFCYFPLFLLFLACKDTTDKGARQENSAVGPVIEASAPVTNSTKKILFFGDSLTAGYGLENTNEAYPGVIQQKIDSLGLDFEVVNAGVSGETTSGGRARIEWILNQPVDVFVLELGANDGLRGLPLTETRKNLQEMITIVQKKDPKIEIVLVGMQLPPNMGQDYTARFKQLFEELAQENPVSFVPFLLKDVGGVAELNQADGIHPTVEGHRILAQNVWKYLHPVLQP